MILKLTGFKGLVNNVSKVEKTNLVQETIADVLDLSRDYQSHLENHPNLGWIQHQNFRV